MEIRYQNDPKKIFYGEHPLGETLNIEEYFSSYERVVLSAGHSV
jgi:hypothetical protein